MIQWSNNLKQKKLCFSIKNLGCVGVVHWTLNIFLKYGMLAIICKVN